MLERLTAAGLRRELSVRAMRWGRMRPHEATYGGVPSVLFQEHAGGHGNFLEASYRAIVADAAWAARLGKSYSAEARVPRRWDRRRKELDCANSSDALLMNVFCYPGILEHRPVCALLGVERGLRPVFGHSPRLPLGTGRNGRALVDRTEVDMLLGGMEAGLLVEAKLTEGSFQTAPIERVRRYAGFDEVFDEAELPARDGVLRSYQLVRGVLAARHEGRSFVVLCDARRVDLREMWFLVMRAVRGCELRSRLAMVTWQEIAAVAPVEVQGFLAEKYGIEGEGIGIRD
jgi:hypothetical protein